jgi:hypothetical protein
MANDELPAEAAEAARTRRRWINLAELLAVIAVLISGLTLWNSYKERTADEAEKAAAREQASAQAQRLLLRGAPNRDGDRLALAPADGAQAIQSQTIAFPAALGAASVDTVIEPRIEASWFARPLLRGRDGDGESRGDERVPAAITTIFVVAGATHRDTAIYDIGYRVDEGGLIGGSKLRLRGLSRVESVPAGRARARLDAIWRARHPAPARP